MSGEQAMVDVLLREIPEAYRGPGYAVVRNNVYELVLGADGVVKKHLVTQLQAASRLRLPAQQVVHLMQGMALGTSTLATVGSACAVATLGVAVIGFAAVGYGLHRIGKRLESVQAGVDNIARDTRSLVAAVELLDLKVDHLLLLSREQGEALRQINYQLHLRDFAEIRGALETLEVRGAEPTSVRRDAAITQAVEGLQVHRLRFSQWLADCPEEAGNVAAELAQATTLLALAESRARLVLGDGAFAERVLDVAGGALRQTAARATTYAMDRWSLTSLLGRRVDGLDVADTLARTVAWATGEPAEAVAAAQLRRVVSEAVEGRKLGREILAAPVMMDRRLDLPVAELKLDLMKENHALAPTDVWSQVRGKTRRSLESGPYLMMQGQIEAIRTLRTQVTESIARFGDPTSPASRIAGFDTYLRCGERLDAALLGVRFANALGWSDDRIRALADAGEPAAVLRPSFQLEFVRMAA